ncbi:MAG TPA: GAF domain-containing sensor histidine kinase [Gaiellaceae bacterium]|jgi:signal transduction histidine kinase
METDVSLLAEIVATQEAISTAEFNLEAVMREVVEQSRGLTRADAAVVEMVEGDQMVYRAVAGTAEPFLGFRLDASRSLSGLCAATGETIYCEDTEDDPRVDREATRTVGARSMMVVPLRHDGAVPYVLKVYSGEPAAFGERERQVLRILAASLAAAIGRAALLDDLSRVNDELRALDRLKDEFVALVSHELRTPLTSVIGYVRALLEGHAGELSDEQTRLLKVVDRNASRLVTVVSDLLLVAQADAGRLTLELGQLELAGLAEQRLAAAEPQASQAGVELSLDASAAPLVRGDQLRLGQVLDNLVSNAIKFSETGGRVTVRVRTEADGALVEVADDGVGIPVEEQEQLFERFFRASSGGGVPGSGLGLSVVKTLVELHGGTIELESAEGAGTTVRVRLPAADAGREAA